MNSTTTSSHRSSVTLRRLLTEELSYSPTIQGIYSDHTAMALAALDQMGASDARLEELFRRQTTSEAEPRTDVDELEARRAEVRRLGIAETVRRRVPHLVVAPGSALFHPAIRLAYALDADHADQVAAALLDWETRREILDLASPSPGDRDLYDAAASLTASAEGTWDRTYDLERTARRREVADALHGVDLDRLDVDDIADFALSVHVAADTFVSLHMVTGARAVHRISQMLEADVTARFVAAAATTMVVLHATVGAPPLPSPAEAERLRSTELPSMSQIAERAIADDDPHVIKLANVALVEEERTGDPLYRLVAARVVGWSERAP